MIKAIREIGEYVLRYSSSKKAIENEDIIKAICNDLDLVKKNKDNTYIQRVIIINFNLESDNIEIDFEQINDSTAKKYVWIGNTIRPKLYCVSTSNTINRLLSSTIYELKNITSNNLAEALNNVYIKFFKNFEVIDKKNKKSIKRLIDYTKFNFDQNDKLPELDEKLAKTKIKEEYDKIEKEYYRILNKNILEKTKLKKEEVSIYSIAINKKIVSQFNEYKDMLVNEKINELFSTEGIYKNNVTKNGICSICNSRINVTSNFSSFTLKFFINDKLGFSSNLDGKFIKNFNTCQRCYQDLIVGENFIRNNLNTNIGLKTYIIPKFISEEKIEINNFAKYLRNKTYRLTNLESIKEFEGLVEVFSRFEEGIQNYLINYLFYEKSKSEFKVLKLIKDIPPTRLNYIQRIEEDISNFVDEKFNSNNYFKVSLNKIWGNIPVRKKDNHGYSKFLEIIDSIFSDIKIDYNFLIKQFVETIRIIKYNNENYNIQINSNFTDKIMQQNFILLFFKKLGILGGFKMSENGIITENENLLLPKDILEYFTDLEIYSDKQKQALFLLGYLVGEIGSQQSQTSDTKKKTILNKINFQGMDYNKLIRLTNDVFEKLVQNKILSFNENIFSAAKQLLESNAHWQLSNQENVFYVLSGYAFSNFMIRKRSKDSYNNLLPEAKNIINVLKEAGNDTTEFEGFLQQAIDFANGGNYSKAKNYLNKILKENKNG